MPTFTAAALSFLLRDVDVPVVLVRTRGVEVEAAYGVGPGVVDALVGGVVVDRVGDEQHRAVVVVEHREVGREQHRDLGHADLVGVVVGQALPPAHHVVGQVADHPAGERGQAREPLGVQRLDGVAQGRCRVAVGRQADRRVAPPLRVTVDLPEDLTGGVPMDAVATAAVSVVT